MLQELLVIEEEKLQKSPLSKETVINIKDASFGWRQDVTDGILSEGDYNNNFE